jgi:hypothetical protein
MSRAIEVFGAALAAGVVEAQREQDGTIRVRGVPVFSEVRVTDPGVAEGARAPRDKAWLEGALALHRERLKLGYKPPLTVRHFNDSPRSVGWFELTGLERVLVNPGEPERWTLVADKVYTSEEAFEAARDYPYRSAEISVDKPLEISALALLRDRAPFHAYPNTVETLGPEARAVVEAFRARGGSSQVWKESRMGTITVSDADWLSKHPSALAARRDLERAVEAFGAAKGETLEVSPELHAAVDGWLAAVRLPADEVEAFDARFAQARQGVSIELTSARLGKPSDFTLGQIVEGARRLYGEEARATLAAAFKKAVGATRG